MHALCPAPWAQRKLVNAVWRSGYDGDAAASRVSASAMHSLYTPVASTDEPAAAIPNAAIPDKLREDLSLLPSIVAK